MRTLLKVTCPVEASNKAVADGTMVKIVKSVTEKFHPEATYFLPLDGCRTMLFVFDLKDSSDLPVIAEPFFSSLNAKLEFTPVMNAEDLQKGLANAGVVK
ncbi:MAG: hypothetical protein J7623_25705 [Chitinophaga sp.]|uniref:hypothetical protein n=1 Tax=Chitinophaga sp. TaxID=1869181 RepID=UPI001B05C1E4|nr:hypothetical protein [Chitinophaga sp.]MBO9732063.1 hypothetical protein [Chitinophaga sp.]